MRKIVLSLAAAGAVLAAASPAAAQYYPAPQPAPYGYGHNGFGQNGWGQFRSLQTQLENIERQIDRLDRRDRIGDRSADRLREEANRIERRLHERARGGLDPREAGEIQYRVQRLQQQVQFAAQRQGGWHDRDDRWDRHDRD